MGLARPVLRVGDRVVFDGDEHQVVGLSGTSVRLRPTPACSRWCWRAI